MINLRANKHTIMTVSPLSHPWDDVGYSTLEDEDESQQTLVETIHSALGSALSKASFTADRGSSDKYAEVFEMVLSQLKEYVMRVAENYHSAHFHSFRHAAQVFLNAYHLVELAMTHPGTWSMSSAHAFCLLFCALIHDIDHHGLTNTQMIKENVNGLSTKYSDGSLAEHNSIDLALTILQEPQFNDLHEAICRLKLYNRSVDNNLDAFTRMVTALVLSTDIMSAERMATNRSKWNKTFNIKVDLSSENADVRDESILENLLQLADVGHCTQRWETFVLWNQRLLTELVSAAAKGKGADPSDVWFNGQTSFFDNYIIPLSERIRMGNIFSQDISDTFLFGAIRNKMKWKEEGAVLCQRMKEVAHEASLQATTSIDSDLDDENRALIVSSDKAAKDRLSLSSTVPSTENNSTESQPNIWSR